MLRLLLPVIISLLVQVPASLLRARIAVVLEVPISSVIVLIALAVLGPLALLGARRFPGPTVAVVSLGAALDVLLSPDVPGPLYIAFAFAVVGAIVRGARVWAWVAIGIGWLGCLLLASTFGVEWPPGRIAATTFGIVVIIGVAESVRTRAERLREVERVTATRRQSEMQAERVRIARELHDVLAHSLSQINVQASVGLHLAERQPETAAAALSNIKESSKSALEEVRSVLGALRAEPGSAPIVPEPDLSRLPSLVGDLARDDLRVELRDELRSVPPAAIQLALFRIAQESLTNVVRHSGASSAWVILTEHPGLWKLEVGDDGHGALGHPDAGRGLVGMRERAELLGGSLETESTTTGFTVRGTIPKGGEST